MQDFRKLSVWEKAHRLTLRVYGVTERFPRTETFGLALQMRRSSSSIPTNIAEGCGRGSNPDMARFLQIAMGSASELEYQLILARDLIYLPAESFPGFETDVMEVKRMLASLIARVRAAT